MLRLRYGLSLEHFDEMLGRQSGFCAICGRAPAAHVDHDHGSGEVRGLLCFHCNNGLGHFKDNIALITAAISYLEGTPRLWLVREDAPGYGKVCRDCNQAKSFDSFPKNRSTRDGLGVYCKSCHNERTRQSVAAHGGARRYHLRRKYGIDLADFDRLVRWQGGVCAICREAAPEQVDHDHVTGKVRGVLCLNCNAGMGHFADDVDVLEQAANYLKHYEKVEA